MNKIWSLLVTTPFFAHSPCCHYAGLSFFQTDWAGYTCGSPGQQRAPQLSQACFPLHPNLWLNSTFLLWIILQPRKCPKEWDRVLKPGLMDREKGAEEGQVRIIWLLAPYRMCENMLGALCSEGAPLYSVSKTNKQKAEWDK